MEFKQAIKMYLDVQSMSDAEFGKKYSNPNKSIDECCLYIQTMILKKAMEGKDEEKVRSACAVPTDEEVFSLAVQYYMDEDLKVDGSEFDNIKVLSMSATTFTDEEKEKMREEAIKKYQDDVIAEQKKKDQEKKAKKSKDKKPNAPTIVPDVPKEEKKEGKKEKKEEKTETKVVQMGLNFSFD